MRFSGNKHLVGLDIGSTFIKVAELKISKKRTSLKKFGLARIPHGAILEDRIKDKDTVAGVIKKLFKDHKIKEKNVAISTGGHSVVIKTISTAKVPARELHKTIFSEAEQYIPYDVEDVNIDYQILGDSEYSSEQMNILLVAAKKDLVAEYIELIQTAGLNPKIIDVDTFALQNVYETLPGLSPDTVALLVDVGASKISLNILKGSNSLMMRDTVSGTNQILEALSDRLGIGIEAAETLLSEKKEEVLIREISDQVSSAWCSQICEVVNSFRSNANEKGLSTVLLSGGGASVKGFARKLQSEIDAAVSIMEPFSGLEIDEKMFPASRIRELGPQAPIALGLAMRRVDDK